EDRVEQASEERRRRAPAAGAHDHLAPGRVLDRVDRDTVPDDRQSDLGRRRAQPIEPDRIEIRFWHFEQWCESHCVIQRADDRAIVRCYVPEIKRYLDRGAGHVLHDDRSYPALDVIWQVASYKSRAGVVTAARARGENSNGLVAIETFCGIRRGNKKH